MDIIKREYAGVFAFLAESKKWLFAAAALFVAVAVAAGLICGAVYREAPEKVTGHFEQLAEMVESAEIMDEQGEISAVKLFLHNVTAALTAYAMGFVPFLFLSLLSILINGAAIGVVTAVAKQLGLGYFAIFVSIAPHGLFELPALLMAMALGMRFCFEFSAFLRHRRGGSYILECFGESARVIALAVTPLLAVAAVIEVYLTPALVAVII